MTDAMRTYEIVTSTGKQRITVPEDTKLTFGAIVPGAEATGYSGGGWGLRLWTSRDHQLAVFTDVISFRDLSIPLTVAAVRKFGAPDDEWTVDDGSYTGRKGETVEKQWKPIEEVKTLPPKEPMTDDDEFRTATLYPSAKVSARGIRP